MKGRIKFFDIERGYGFVIPLAGGRDVMLHAKTIAGAFPLFYLTKGVYVEIDVNERETGQYATSVRLIFTITVLPTGWAVRHNKTSTTKIFTTNERVELLEWMENAAVRL